MRWCWFAVVGLVGVAPARADVPIGWQVETFAGRILEIAPGGGVLACASDGGLLFFELGTGEFHQLADAGCADGRCLRSNQLTCVARDGRGRYWLGTRGAGLTLLRVEPGGFGYEHFFAATFRPGGGLLADSVTAVAPWGDDVTYVGTRAGVAQIDLAGEVAEYNEESSRRRGVDGFPDAAVLDVAADSTWVWAALTTGVVRYRRLPPHDVEVLGDSLAGTRAFTVVRQHGEIWVGTDAGVHVWDETRHSWRRLRNAAGVTQPTPDLAAYSLVVRQADPLHPVVAAGSDADMWTYNGFAWSRCNPPPLFLLEARRFSALAATGDTLWTSQGNASGEGAFLESWDTVQGCAWTRHAPNSIPPGPLRNLSVDRNTRDLWVGTQIAGVARRDVAGTWCVTNANDTDVRANMTNPAGNVSALLVDRTSTVWFAYLALEQQSALDILRGDPNCDHAGDQWSHIAPGAGGYAGRTWEIAEDGAGNRFFLSDGHPVSPGGLDVLAADGSDTLNLRADLLGGSTVGAIAFDRTDGTWQRAYVGVDNLGAQGLREWRNSDDLFSPTQDNFSILSVAPYNIAEYRDIVYDAGNDDLWVGTLQGLFRYDLQRRRVETLIGQKSLAADGLLSLDVRDLLLDPQGNLWIGTDKGLYRIDTRDSLMVVDAFTTREMLEALNQESGGVLYLPERSLAPLPDARVNGLAFDAAVQHLHVGTEAGLATLDVTALDVRNVVPIDRAVVYPNPVRALSGDAAVYLGDVTVPAHVTVYSLEGEIVAEKVVTDASVPAWDLRIVVNSSSSGVQFFQAASGVYLVRVSNEAGTKVTPLAVIR